MFLPTRCKICDSKLITLSSKDSTSIYCIKNYVDYNCGRYSIFLNKHRISEKYWIDIFYIEYTMHSINDNDNNFTFFISGNFQGYYPKKYPESNVKDIEEYLSLFKLLI